MLACDRVDSSVWEDAEPAESFQPPDVGESPTGEFGEFGPPASLVFFFLRNPRVMMEEGTKPLNPSGRRESERAYLGKRRVRICNCRMGNVPQSTDPTLPSLLPRVTSRRLVEQGSDVGLGNDRQRGSKRPMLKGKSNAEADTRDGQDCGLFQRARRRIVHQGE